MGTQTPLPKTAEPAIFGACLLWSNGCIWIEMSLGTEVGLGLRDNVLDGDPAPPPLKVHSPQFSADVRCGQTAGWTKMPLGMEVFLGPGDFVGWGPSSLQKKGQTSGCIKMPLVTEVGLSPDNFVVDRDPAPLRKRGGAPNLWPTSIVVKRLHGSRCHLVRR